MTQQSSRQIFADRFGMAMTALVGAILLRWLLDPLLHDQLPLTALFAAISITVWQCGYRYALLVAALGYLACLYLFVDPRGTITFHQFRDFARLSSYLLISLVIIGFGEAARRAKQRYRLGEAAARQRADTLSFVLANVGDGVITTDVLGHINGLNPVAESLTGWQSAEAASRPLTTVFRIVNEQTRAPVDDLAKQVLSQHRAAASTIPAVLIGKQGKETPIENSAAPIMDSAGSVIGVAVIFHEISERREAERRQQESRAEALRLLELNRTIVMNMGEGLYTVDQQGLVTFMNPAAERLLGWSSAELLGRNMHEAIHYKHPDGSAFPIEECAGAKHLRDGQAVVDCEDTFVRKDGSFLPVAYSCSPFQSAGATVGLVVVFRDTTEQKRAEQQLRALATDLSAADRRKDVFLATLAHELRNPLAPIRNGLEIIRRNVGSAAAVEQMRVIMERQLGQLIHLVDDLLDVSRIGLGKITLRKEPIDLRSVLSDALDTSRPLIEAKGHEVVLDVPEEPIVLEADRTRLVQVFVNVLNNAAKYSSRGGRIRLSARRQGNDVLVRVQDGGYGIPPDKLPHIFEMFSQVERSSEQSQGGIGVGLALVKHLVGLHGGSIEARSDGDGQGSEFAVLLPALPAQELESPAKLSQRA